MQQNARYINSANLFSDVMRELFRFLATHALRRSALSLQGAGINRISKYYY